MAQLEAEKAPEQLTNDIAACKPLLPLRFVAMRAVVVTAIGLNITGPADMYSAVKSLKAYTIIAERLSAVEIAMGVASYLASAAAMGALSYILLSRIFTAEDGGRPLMQRSKAMRCASIAFGGTWMAHEGGPTNAVDMLRRHVVDGSVSVLTVFFKMLGFISTIYVMGLAWHGIVNEAFKSPKPPANVGDHKATHNAEPSHA